MHPIQFLVENLMLPLLKFFYTISHNYALAIILLTVAVKIVFYPLNKKQFVSMKKMTELQPLVKEIQSKFKDNPQQLQAETMKLYKEKGVNPLGGCLPMLVQLPFFIALFVTLRSEAFGELIAAQGAMSSFIWITDLSAPDPIKALPIIIGISTWLSQKTMSTDPQQAKMMAFMPVFMVVISWSFPAGVLIYWAFQQILTGLQQLYLAKTLDFGPKPVPVKVTKEKSKAK